jgi:hypothetical protein
VGCFHIDPILQFLWRLLNGLSALQFRSLLMTDRSFSGNGEAMTADSILDLLHKHIELDWLYASDGHPDIVGHQKAADAILALLSAVATGERDLMPGAIEDEPKVDPICVLQGQIDEARKRIEQSAHVIAGMAAALASQPRSEGTAKPVAWRVCWVSLNTSRTELFEGLAKATAKANENDGCVIPLYAVPAQVIDYSAWLIEINDSATSSPVYFHFEHDDDWTMDHDKAVHFARKQDAESVIEHYGWTRAKAVEHMWPVVTAQENKS